MKLPSKLPLQITPEKLGPTLKKKWSQHFCSNNIMERPITLQHTHMHSFFQKNKYNIKTP